MRRKTLILTLITAGLVLAATSAAFSLYPANWFAKDKPVGMSTSAETLRVSVAAPASPVPPGAIPNYRAIVQQAGPAVVGISVAAQAWA